MQQRKRASLTQKFFNRFTVFEYTRFYRFDIVFVAGICIEDTKNEKFFPRVSDGQEEGDKFFGSHVQKFVEFSAGKNKR